MVFALTHFSRNQRAAAGRQHDTDCKFNAYHWINDVYGWKPVCPYKMWNTDTVYNAVQGHEDHCYNVGYWKQYQRTKDKFFAKVLSMLDIPPLHTAGNSSGLNLVIKYFCLYCSINNCVAEVKKPHSMRSAALVSIATYNIINYSRLKSKNQFW